MAEDRRAALIACLAPVIAEISRSEWNDRLRDRLNRDFPVTGSLFREITRFCDDGIETGWMGLAGSPERQGGRVVEPSAETAGHSIDVVQLIDFTGPHHAHPGGEVCAIMTERPEGRFDGNPAGWAVYPPGSAHWPSGTGGRVRILFFLPNGEIAYSDDAAALDSGTAGA